MDTELRRALTEGEFRLHLQPIIDILDDRVVGAEALLRWQHPQHGLLAPMTFLPRAEAGGIIGEIGLWALEAACRQLAAWRDAGVELTLSLNVSTHQIPQALPAAALAGILGRHGVDPVRLALEITETALLAEGDGCHQWLEQVRQAGCRIHLDDFGTGQKSLSFLTRFPIDTVKIDRSFIRDMATDNSDRALIEAVVVMARTLRLRVIAEGVENLEQLAHLRRIRCRGVQGFYYSPPVPAEEFAATAQRVQAMLAADRDTPATSGADRP